MFFLMPEYVILAPVGMSLKTTFFYHSGCFETSQNDFRVKEKAKFSFMYFHIKLYNWNYDKNEFSAIKFE